MCKIYATSLVPLLWTSKIEAKGCNSVVFLFLHSMLPCSFCVRLCRESSLTGTWLAFSSTCWETLCPVTSSCEASGIGCIDGECLPLFCHLFFPLSASSHTRATGLALEPHLSRLWTVYCQCLLVVAFCIMLESSAKEAWLFDAQAHWKRWSCFICGS